MQNSNKVLRIGGVYGVFFNKNYAFEGGEWCGYEAGEHG